MLLKAIIIDKNESIYYKDKQNRTISLIDAVKKIYPDKHTRIRLNLEKIIELRNISTHFITEEYEVEYAPLFQACVLNYTNELEKYQNRDITKYISQDFLTLSTRYEPLSNEQIKMKYPAEIAQRLYIPRKKKNADFTVGIERNSENFVAIVKDIKDPSDTH